MKKRIARDLGLVATPQLIFGVSRKMLEPARKLIKGEQTKNECVSALHPIKK